MQSLDYAVLNVDRRGHGSALARQQVVSRDPEVLVNDLQTSYEFLIDRHNRRELNVAKLGVIAVGDGANLAALWAASPEGAVSSPGRASDLGALVLICPAPDAFNTRLTTVLTPLAPRLPMYLVASSRDTELFNALRPIVEKNRASKGILFESRLQGERLLRFEPKAVDLVTKFLNDPVKFRTNATWEPRYLLDPIAYEDIEIVPGKPAPAEAAKKAEEKKVEPAKKEAEKGKEEAEKK